METIEEAQVEALEYLGKSIDKFQDADNDEVVEILEVIKMEVDSENDEFIKAVVGEVDAINKMADIAEEENQK